MRTRIFLHPVVIIFICLLLAGLSACTQGSTAPPNGGTTTQPIKIGFSYSTTGDFSQDGPLLKLGYVLWAQYVNAHGGLLGRQVQLVEVTDDSKPETAVTAYNTLIHDRHVDLLLAPFGSPVEGAARVAYTNHLPFVEGTDTEGSIYTSGYTNLFVVSLPADRYLQSFATFILSLPAAKRPKTVVFTTADDPFTRPPVDLAAKLLTSPPGGGVGLKQLDYITYPDETTSFGAIAQKVINDHPDLVVSGTLGLPDCSALINAFKQQHFNPEAFIASAGPDQGADFVKAVGPKAAEGVFVPNDGWYPNITTYQNSDFQQLFVAQDPQHSAQDITSDTVQAFAAGQVLGQAVTEAGSLSSASILRVLSKQGATFNSIQGPVQFDAQGRNALSTAYLFQWQGGNLVVVYPSSATNALNPEFPKAPWS